LAAVRRFGTRSPLTSLEKVVWSTPDLRASWRWDILRERISERGHSAETGLSWAVTAGLVGRGDV
jgi:hypothetical protein